MYPNHQQSTLISGVWGGAQIRFFPASSRNICWLVLLQETKVNKPTEQKKFTLLTLELPLVQEPAVLRSTRRPVAFKHTHMYFQKAFRGSNVLRENPLYDLAVSHLVGTLDQCADQGTREVD